MFGFVVNTLKGEKIMEFEFADRKPDDRKRGIAQRFTVVSDSGKRYNMAYKDGWQCSCPGWIYTSPRKSCKHIQEYLNRVQMN